MKARRVNENISFERGTDPREQMGIGDAEIQTINKLDRLARRYGFEKVELDPRDEEEGIINIQRWFDPEYEVQVLLYKHEDWKPGELFINWEDLEGSGNDSAEQWLDPNEWESHYGEDREMYENVSFERGMDPKRSMGIGMPNLDNPDYKWKEIDPQISSNKWAKNWASEAYETTYKGKIFRMYDTYFLSVVFEDGSEGFMRVDQGRYSRTDKIQDLIVEPMIREFLDEPH